MATEITTKRATYILTEFPDGTAAIITAPHGDSECSRSFFRDGPMARLWLKRQQDYDAGRRFAHQGLLK